MRNRKPYYFRIAACLICSAWAGGCNIINRDEPVPAYLYIEPFTFSCDVGTQGYPSEKITDAWVYVNGRIIGVYELPAEVPVLEKGMTDLIISPGIKENGISGNGVIYPFYKAYSLSADLEPDVTDSIHPSTVYATGLDFIYLERFETGNSFDAMTGSDAGLDITTNPADVFEGLRSGAATLYSSIDTLLIHTDNNYVLPQAGGTVFLEMDYKTNINFEIWLTAYTTSYGNIASYALTVTPKDTWNKIYINLTPKLDFFQPYSPNDYKLEIRAYKPSSTDTARLFFDNFKMISFPF